MREKAYTLGELAELSESQLEGDRDLLISRVATLTAADAGAISFLANARYRRQLAGTKASAVVVSKDEAIDAPRFALLRSSNPYLAFARISRVLNPLTPPQAGIDPSASVAASAQIAKDVEVGPQVVIAAQAKIGEGSVIGPGTVIGEAVVIGKKARIGPNVSIMAGSKLGDRVSIDAGTVIGGAGFGFAHAGDHWEAVPQLGGVLLGDDVSIGCNVTVDRGAQEDTVIEQGCKIDNLVQIAHNVHIGAHTVIAASTGISGSTRIGRHCMIGGAVGFAGHLEIADHSTFTGMAMVTGHVREPGVYSSGIPAAPNREWRRNAVRFGQLEAMARRLEALERQMNSTGEKNDE